jgi:5-methylcytosine-specific restriction endonuclease McrA
MITLAEYPVHELMPLIGMGNPPIELVVSGYPYKVKLSGVRLECFKRNAKCVSCRLIGTVFKLQSHEYKGPKLGTNCFLNECPWCALRGYKTRRRMNEWQKPHLNLFAKDRGGNMILMTKDHIYPKSKGGSDGIENMQTMCVRCNQNKADTIPEHYMQAASE